MMRINFRDIWTHDDIILTKLVITCQTKSMDEIGRIFQNHGNELKISFQNKTQFLLNRIAVYWNHQSSNWREGWGLNPLQPPKLTILVEI